MCILTLSSFFMYLQVTWSHIIIHTEIFSFQVPMVFSAFSSEKTLRKWHVKFLGHIWWKFASTAGSLLVHLQKTSMHLHMFAEFQSKNKNPEQNFLFFFFLIFAAIKWKFFLSVKLFGNNSLCKTSQNLRDKWMGNKSTVSCLLMILCDITRENLSTCCPQVVSHFFFLQAFTAMLHPFYSLSSELGFFSKKIESLKQTEFSFDSQNMWFKMYIFFLFKY